MVTIKSSYTVLPEEPTPNVKLWLPDIDLLAPLRYTPTIHFYKPFITTSSLPSPIETVKMSLSRALVLYYPLAGRLIDTGGSRCELHCNAMGALLVEAESDAKLEDFGDFCPTPEIEKLVPYVDDFKIANDLPLLLVQLTMFKCGGISIGMRVSHVVMDGHGASDFISLWTKLARGEKVISCEPFHDRTIFYKGDRTIFYKGNPSAKPRFDHVAFKPPPTLLGEQDNEEKETKVAMLKLTKFQQYKLKEKANQGITSDHYSRFEAIAGNIWRCVCMARGLKNEQLTSLCMPVNCRNRLRPPLPSGYYGNAILSVVATAESGELTSNTLGLRNACSKIREAIEMADENYIRSTIDFLANRLDMGAGGAERAFVGSPNVAVTSWLRLPIYDADFGWGKPVFMGPTIFHFDGKSFLIPGGEDESVIVAIRLQVNHMDDFQRLFYQDLLPDA